MRQPKTESSKSIIYKGRRGPCTHCGIKSTPQWRPGPDYKPILCNPCGSRWNMRKSLVDYIPRHGLAEGNRPEVSHIRTPPNQVAAQDTAKAGSANSSSESATSNTDSGIIQRSFWDSPIPKKKRSVLNQYVRTSNGMLQKKLKRIQHQPEFSTSFEDDEEEVLISQIVNNQISPGEIGLGCVLLKPSKSTNE